MTISSVSISPVASSDDLTANLPYEIFENIFKYFPQNQFTELKLVSKRWLEIASKVEIERFNKCKLRFFDVFSETDNLVNWFSAHSMSQNLTCANFSNLSVNEEQLENFTVMCPNLQSLLLESLS